MAFITILGSGETVKNYFWGSSGSPSTRYRTISSACVASNRFVPTGSFFPTYGVPSLRIGLKLTPPSGLKVSGNRHERNRFTIYLICSSLTGLIVTVKLLKNTIELGFDGVVIHQNNAVRM